MTLLKGMPLTNLNVALTEVTDLTPLDGMNLQTLSFTPRKITQGIDVVRRMKSLGSLNLGGHYEPFHTPEVFWKKYDAGEFKK